MTFITSGSPIVRYLLFFSFLFSPDIVRLNIAKYFRVIDSVEKLKPDALSSDMIELKKQSVTADEVAQNVLLLHFKFQMISV